MSDGDYIDSPPEGIEGWRKVWQERKSYRGRLAPGIFRSVEAIFERLLHPHVARQRDFNIVLLDLLRDVKQDVAALRDDYRKDLEQLRNEIRRLNELVPVASKRNDALLMAVDQKIEALSARLRDVTTPLMTPAAGGSLRDDFVYRRFEEAMRGDEASVRASVTPYADLAQSNQPVIDIGCGRGEFLELCRERGIEARGYDTNERSVADLMARGLKVERLGIPDCFAQHPGGSLGAVFASHVVEHLPFDVLLDFFTGAARVLRRSGLLMIETPNASSLTVAASEFWRDPTHLAPRPLAALVVLARETGFDVAEAKTVHPFDEARRLKGTDEATRRLDEILFGDQDLRLVLRKS